MNIQKIYNLINHAHKEESVGGDLRNLIRYRIEYLHNNINLPDENSIESLHSFICNYISCTPKFFEAICKEHKESCRNGFLSPFLAIIEDNFLLIGKHSKEIFGLDSLINKAFFALRLLEDLNDVYIIQTKTILIHQDLTMPNLITHEILGEPFANDIDNIVQETIKNFATRHKYHKISEVMIPTNTTPKKPKIGASPQYYNLSIDTVLDL